MNPNRLIGLYYVASLFHSGQWSKGYRLMCRINFKGSDNAHRLQPKSDWFEARQFAAYYMRYARKYPNKF